MTNLLLDLMPPDVRQELLLSGAEFELRAGDCIPSEQLTGDYLFIPVSGVASQLQVAEIGRVSEVGMVGREGMFPLSALLRVPAAPHMVLCQADGLKGQRLRTREFHHIISDDGEAQLLVRKYVYAFVTQIASNIVSTEQSMVAAKLARWLLMCHDRIDGDRIPVTHDALAQMIFSHRPTVTNTLNLMRTEDLIDMSRGAVTILSRAGLRRMSDGYYGLSELYWQRHIGRFGKDELIQEEESKAEKMSEPLQISAPAVRSA